MVSNIGFRIGNIISDLEVPNTILTLSNEPILGPVLLNMMGDTDNIDTKNDCPIPIPIP